MTSFLTLPIELRANIIEDVILSRIPVPQDIDAVRLRRSPRRRDARIDGCDDTRIVRPEQARMLPNSLGLLLCNRLLYTETQAAIARLQEARPFEFHLDVMIIDKDEMWPTWLFAPATMPFLSRVLITFRLFDAQDKLPDPHTPSLLLSGFYDIFEQLLLVAPGLGAMAIGLLEVEFLDDGTAFEADNPTSQLVQWSLLQEDGDMQGAPNDVVVPRSNWIANGLARHMSSVLEVHRMSRFGELMFERVGSLRVCAEPWVDRHFAFGDMLAELEFGSPAASLHASFSQTARGHWAWKNATLKKRREAGLHIGSPILQRPPSPIPIPDVQDNVASHDEPVAASTPRKLVDRLRAGLASFRRQAVKANRAAQ